MSATGHRRVHIHVTAHPTAQRTIQQFREAIPADHTDGMLIHDRGAILSNQVGLREAADQMAHHDIGRLPVVLRTDPDHVIGIITHSELLRAHRQRLEELHHTQQSIRLRVDRPPAPVGTERFAK
jgi:hypothetical protein